MERASRVRRVVAAFVCVVLASGCSQAGEAEELTLSTATRQLLDDANKLLASAELKEVGQVRTVERAEADKPGACLPGRVQRFFRGEGDFARPNQQSPGVTAGLLGTALRTIGYDEHIDNLDLLDDNLSVMVMVKPKAGITFLIAARNTKPNILIVGKTECLTPDG